MRETVVDQVLAALRARDGKMSTAEVVEATRLDVAEVESALQSLLLRREVRCGSHERAGRGGQIARFVGASMDPMWIAVGEGHSHVRPEGACFEQRPRSRADRRKNRVVGEITIVSAPSGEVPAEIRQAWVGLTVPVTSAESRPVWAVPTGEPSDSGPMCLGYSIDAGKCLASLREHAPRAAAWWAEHFTHLMGGGRCVFSADDCDLSLRRADPSE